MSQCAYSLDAASWTDLPVGPQFDLSLNIDEQTTELVTDGGVIWTEKLFERDAWNLTFKLRTSHVAAFRAMHDAVDGQLERLFLTLDRTADPVVVLYGWKEAGFALQGTGEPVVPPVFNYRFTISGEKMSILTLLRSYAFSDLPADPAAGALARVSDSPGGLWMYSGLRWVRVTGELNVQDAPYNAAGDGVTNDSPAIQSAINDARATGLPVRIPRVPVGYLCSDPLDLTDSDRLTIYGDGFVPPANALFEIAPTNSSTLIGNTGTGGCVICAIGSNGLTMRGFNVSSLGAPNPSTIGMLLGTSTRSVAGPGSSAYYLKQIAVYMPEVADSLPIYCNNVNASNFEDVWTVGDTGIVFDTENPRGIVPPYSAWGPDIQNDGNVMKTCSCLAFSGYALWLHKVNNFEGQQVYLNTLRGGPGYTGTSYAIYSAGCIDVRLKVEIDYFPCVVFMEEFHKNVRIDGSTFPSTTPTGIDLPVIAFFNATGSPLEAASLEHCHFNVTPVMGALPNANFHYTTQGGNPGLVRYIRNCTFIYDTVASPNVLFFNMTSDDAVPLFSNRLEGDSDTITNTLLIDDGVMPTSAYRMFVNGVQIGIA